MSSFRDVTPQFAVSDQLGPEDVARAAAEGFRAIVCNRPDNEAHHQPTARQIAAAAEEHGLAFIDAPVPGPGALTPDFVIDLVKRVEAAGGPALAYCGSGRRSILAWAFGSVVLGADPIQTAVAVSRAGYDVPGLADRLAEIAAARPG